MTKHEEEQLEIKEKNVKLTAQFNRANISSHDFQEALEYLSALDENYPQVVRRSLLVSAIIAYSRPFTRNAPGSEKQSTNQLSINIKKVFQNEEITEHEKILSLRNEGAAHSSYDAKPSSRVPIEGRGTLTWNKKFCPLQEGINIELFSAMTKKLENYCVTQMINFNEELGLSS